MFGDATLLDNAAALYFLPRHSCHVGGLSDNLVFVTDLHPDIILLDGMIPVMDGFTCCSQLRSLAGGDRIPILIITGLEDEALVNWAFEAGATDYVTKPIHWAVLRQRVRRFLREAQLLKELEQATQELKRLAFQSLQ